jgi:HPr kinase/phosphorylase
VPANKKSVTVGEFYQAAEDKLKLSLIAGGEGLDRRIPEAAINRPGLALTGFFNYFAHRRIQVFGLSETAYLGTLIDDERKHSLREFFDHNIPCLVFARNRAVPKLVMTLSNEFQIPVFRSKLITRDFVNTATIIMENLVAPREMMHGTMVEIMGIGVLIEGKPGTGKSEAALALVKKGHALVADDLTLMRLDSTGSIVATSMKATRFHMEIRGMGIIHVPSLFGVSSIRQEKRLDLIVTLSENMAEFEEDRSGQTRRTRTLLDLEIPWISVPVAAGRDLSNIIEVAALDHKLRILGHDAAKELDERLITMMTGGLEASE